MADRQQISAALAFRAVMASAGYLAIAACVFMLLAAVLPVATLSATINGTEMGGLQGVAGGGVSATGATAGGVLGWLALFAFAGAAAARFVRELAPFRNLVDYAAFSLLAAAVLWSFYDGPIATQVRTVGQLSNMFGGAAGAHAGSGMPALAVSVSPGIGMLFVVLAPVALFLARRREVAAGMVVPT